MRQFIECKVFHMLKHAIVQFFTKHGQVVVGSKAHQLNNKVTISHQTSVISFYKASKLLGEAL